MSFTPELIAELEVLALFNLDNHQEGIKVHSSASPARVAAARRLHDKHLIDQVDGGYLTPAGLEAAESVQHLLNLLKAQQPA